MRAMIRRRDGAAFVALAGVVAYSPRIAIEAFVVPALTDSVRICMFPSPRLVKTSPLSAVREGDDDDGLRRRFEAAASPTAADPLASGSAAKDIDEGLSKDSIDGGAATNTVNERLLAELKAASDAEKYGARSAAGKKRRGDLTIGEAFRTEKTEEERRLSIEKARNLNGINPLVALAGSAFALAGAAGLWAFTNYLGALFASHPVTTDVYTVQRLAQVFRNVVMGLSSLASGFFGVTGLGIFLLGVRVAYGVATGELDPTPIKRSKSEELVLPNVWDLMMGKKPNRRGRGKGNDDSNPFGL